MFYFWIYIYMLAKLYPVQTVEVGKNPPNPLVVPHSSLLSLLFLEKEKAHQERNVLSREPFFFSLII